MSAPFAFCFAGVWEGLRAIIAGLSYDPRSFPVFPDDLERELVMELIRVQYGDAPIRQTVHFFTDGSLFLFNRPHQLLMFSKIDKVYA